MNLLLWGRWALLALWVLLLLLVAWFLVWRQAEEERADTWDATDAFFTGLVASLLFGRIGWWFWQGQWSNWWSFWEFWSKPGLWLFSALLGFAFVGWRWAKRAQIDPWMAWDILVSGWWGVLLVTLGAQILTGGGAGLPTGVSWWGFLYAGRQELAHPVAVYQLILSLGWLWYLRRIEPQYRFLQWYRTRARTARPGFLTASSLIFLGLSEFLLGFVAVPWKTLGISLQSWTGLLLFIAGCGFLYIRSGLYDPPNCRSTTNSSL